ncbi:MAG: exosome complex protein Rrp42 [Nanoarchaeota archaeon]
MELSNINRKRIITLLKEGNRLDGRKPFENREIFIETDISNKAEGSARVRLGKTEVIVGVKLQTQEPYPDHKDEGTLIVGMEINSSAGDRYEPGPPQIDAIEIARVVDRGIRESKYIDLKKLCIKDGEIVWSVMIDIYGINDDGNLLDASFIGALSALKVTKIPVYIEEEGIKYDKTSEKYLPLTKNESLMMTFYKVGDNLLLDPNREEEDISNARLTLAISKSGKDKIIHSMQKGEIESISIKDLNKIIEEAENVYDKLSLELNKLITR